MELLDVVRGSFYTQYLSFAIKLKLFEALAGREQGLDAQELALELVADPEVIESLSKILVELHLLQEKNSRFILEPSVARYVLASEAQFLGPTLDRILMQEIPTLVDGMNKFLKTRKTEPTLENAAVRKLSLEDERILLHTVIESGPFMGAAARASGEELCELKSFSDSKRAVDLGGNDGSFLISVLKKNPDLKGIIVDLPQLQARAEANIKKAFLKERCEFIPLNFFEGPFPKADLYFCGFVLHDWNKAVCFYLLQKIKEAIEPGGRLVLHENLLDDPGKRLLNWGTQLLFLLKRRVCPIVRTSETYRDWLAQNGLSPGEVIYGRHKSFVFAKKEGSSERSDRRQS